MVAQENLCDCLAGIHVGHQANYTRILGTLGMSVVSTPIPFSIVTNPK